MKLRIVLKFGTGILTESSGGAAPDVAQFRRLAAEVAALVLSGHSCVIISSGAVAAGVAALGLSARPTELTEKQACAAVGQSKLMRLYESGFESHGITVAQLLLTHDDIDSRQRRRNAYNTIQRLLGHERVVPVINENDSVAVEELRFGDNDRLGAEVAQLCRADRLLILTSSNGLLDDAGRRMPVVDDAASARRFVTPDRGAMSTGGMETKLEAVRLAVGAGIETWILDGRQPGQIAEAVAGGDVGTRFPVRRATPATA